MILEKSFENPPKQFFSKKIACGAYSGGGMGGTGSLTHHIKKFPKSRNNNIEFEACFRSGSKCSGSAYENSIIAVCLLDLLRGVPVGGVPACVGNRVVLLYLFELCTKIRRG